VVIPDPCVNYVTLSTTVTISCPAPVEILDFTVQTEDEGVHLQWITTSEENTDHFEMLRSNDGIHFQTIGTIKASGNSNSLLTYDFHDNEAFTGIIYYKIVTVDYDGSQQDSEIKSAQKDTKKAIVLSPVFEGETSLLIYGKLNYLEYSIFDMIGREISKASIENPSEKIPIGQDLAPACYLLKIKTNFYSETIKICKVK
jgi:hypothetical protein